MTIFASSISLRHPVYSEQNEPNHQQQLKVGHKHLVDLVKRFYECILTKIFECLFLHSLISTFKILLLTNTFETSHHACFVTPGGIFIRVF